MPAVYLIKHAILIIVIVARCRPFNTTSIHLRGDELSKRAEFLTRNLTMARFQLFTANFFDAASPIVSSGPSPIPIWTPAAFDRQVLFPRRCLIPPDPSAELDQQVSRP